MNNIEWKDEVICFFDGEQHFLCGDTLEDSQGYTTSFYNAINHNDFQLNEISAGDYIEKSELDTEQKYNDFVTELKLFGVVGGLIYSSYETILAIYSEHESRLVIHKTETGLCLGAVYHDFDVFCKRKLTYNQLMSIGKLKRLMDEREDKESTIQEAVKSTINAELDKPIDNVKSPSHYQLIEGVESIEIIARSMTQEQFKGYCLGNTLKYRLRAGKKDALQQDIEKANFYGELYKMHKEKCYD